MSKIPIIEAFDLAEDVERMLADERHTYSSIATELSERLASVEGAPDSISASTVGYWCSHRGLGTARSRRRQRRAQYQRLRSLSPEQLSELEVAVRRECLEHEQRGDTFMAERKSETHALVLAAQEGRWWCACGALCSGRVCYQCGAPR